MVHNTATTPIVQWQRLSPLSFLYYFMKFIGAFFKQGIQGLLPLIAVAITFGKSRWEIIVIILIGLMLLLLTIALLSYIKFRFKISEDTVLIRSGILKKKRLSLNFDRIQNITFKEPLYFRPFKLVIMVIESAGSSAQEISLGGIQRDLAQSIHDTVMNHKSDDSISLENTDETNTPKKSAQENIIKQPISELVFYGLTNNNIWVFAGALAGVLSQIKTDDLSYFNYIKDLIANFIGTESSAIAFYSILGVLLVIALLLLASVIGTIIIYYNYHLTRGDGRFYLKKGLFERQETSVLESKIQSIQISQSWPAKLFKRMTIQLKQVGFSNKNQPQKSKGQQKFIIPSVRRAFAQHFTKILMPKFTWDLNTLKPIHLAYLKKKFLIVPLPLCLYPIVVLTLTSPSIWWWVSLTLPFLWIGIYMVRYQKFGYATDGQHGIIRSGFLGYKLTIFAFYKIQSVKIIQSPGQRRKALADISINLAGTHITLPYIPLAEALTWRDMILKEIDTQKIPWM